MDDFQGLVAQQFQIHFVGGQADNDAIPLDDLLESLRGFERFFELTDSMFLQGRLTLEPLPVQSRLEIRVRRIGPGGSIVAVLEFVNLENALGLAGTIAVGVVSSAVWDGMKVAAAKLWKWRKVMLENRINARHLPRSIEEAVATLEASAREAGIQTSEAAEDPAEIVQSLTASLKEAVAPIDVSVDSINVENAQGDIDVNLGRAEKFAIHSQLLPGYTPVASGEWESSEVKFVKIHTETGHALIRFKSPSMAEQKGTKPCTIVDPAFRRANDPFTRTMSQRTYIKAWTRKAIFNPESGVFRWEVRLSPPMDQLKLFGPSAVVADPPLLSTRPNAKPRKRPQKRRGK